MSENWSMKTEGSSNSIYHQQQVTRETASGSSIPISRFHKAAIDGYVDMLCDASKRDTNLPNADLDGLTPTLLAARSGHLDALRILVGRGGDPERACANGSSALHLASARGHLNCVSFLVNFGANMWSLDNDLHTAKDVAAIEQRKEVLDFLDSMMAKQSALNTKNVQKLKERAKVAAEKRLKLLRKAQLKAIKQVEKDERYLKKLSHNRQLLKAAHSISDIKLVGRHIQPLNCGGQRGAEAGYLSFGGDSGTGGGAGSSVSSSSRLGSSPSLSNLINHKLQMDLLMSRSRHSAQVSQQTRILLGRRSIAGSSNGTTTDESSAYSTSSVSSSAGGGGRRTSPKRPKYSDLVAVNGAELVARWQQKKPSNVQQEQQSLKSTSAGSTIGTKFWGMGGVSRKVQLRRLLRAGAAQSSSDLTNISSASTGGPGQDQKEDGSVLSNKGTQATLDDTIGATGDGIKAAGSSPGNSGGRLVAATSNKLCQVQPTMRLKLNAPVERNQAEDIATTMTIWPPQMMMTRAVSEPDFRSALRQDDDDDDDGRGGGSDCEVGDEILPERTGRLSPTSSGQQQHQIESENTSGGNLCQNEGAKEETEALKLTKQQHHHHHHLNQAANNRDDSQHQLLTQCLSQLKLRHEELTMKKQEADDMMDCSELQTRRNNQQQQQQQMLLRPSKLAHGARAFLISKQMISGGGGDFFDSSDELIKHQLMAGEFPLRPSLIKQKQQQLTKEHQILPNLSAINNGDGSRNIDRSRASGCAAGSTTISVDSIGSAGSFAKRNASSDRSKSDQSSYSSSSTCSTSSSSAETEAPETENNQRVSIMDKANRADTQHHHQLAAPAEAELLPPLPPPLPPKTLSLTTARVNLSNLAASHRNQHPHQQVSSNNDNDTELTIKMFLESNGLEDLGEVFAREKIDLEALMLLNEEDLKSLNILLGPRRKLLKAIGTRKRWNKSRKGGGEINNNNITKPMYIMVDTHL